MAEEKRSLFKEGCKLNRSTICRGRRVSYFAGRVFNLLWGVRHDPNSYNRVLGRIIDLQPVREGTSICGVRMLFRLCEPGKGGAIVQHRDREIRDKEYGPFDTIVQVTATGRAPHPGGDPKNEVVVPIGNGLNKYSMTLNEREPGQEDRFLQITFTLES